MERQPVVVTARALRRFGNESTPTDVNDAVGEVSSDPAEQAALMAALADARRAALQEAEGAAAEDVMTAPRHANGSLLLSVLAEYAEQTGKTDLLTTGGQEAKFDPADLKGWLGTFWVMVKRRFQDKQPWRRPPSSPDPMPDRAMVAVLGDWGTGLYGAPRIAQTIRGTPDFTHLVHLGDVYYSGTEKEIQDRFLALWPGSDPVVSRACNSNHEMYTGGTGYFQLTLPAFRQSSSCFAFQNARWLLVGLDTGYDDHDLAQDQAGWLRGLVRDAGDRKVVLFSHHQPFSGLESQGPKLVSKLGDLLQARRIFAWYWGHEHRCTIFDRHQPWGLFGRCIGHGGMPESRKKVRHLPRLAGLGGSEWCELATTLEAPRSLILDGENEYLGDERAKFAPHGYASLEFRDDHLVERVHTPTGQVIHEQGLA